MGKLNLGLLKRIKNELQGQYQRYVGFLKIFGSSKVLYVKPHQATQHFNGIKQNDGWLKVELFISIQMKMVPVWSFEFY